MCSLVIASALGVAAGTRIIRVLWGSDGIRLRLWGGRGVLGLVLRATLLLVLSVILGVHQDRRTVAVDDLDLIVNVQARRGERVRDAACSGLCEGGEAVEADARQPELRVIYCGCVGLTRLVETDALEVLPATVLDGRISGLAVIPCSSTRVPALITHTMKSSGSRGIQKNAATLYPVKMRLIRNMTNPTRMFSRLGWNVWGRTAGRPWLWSGRGRFVVLLSWALM